MDAKYTNLKNLDKLKNEQLENLEIDLKRNDTLLSNVHELETKIQEIVDDNLAAIKTSADATPTQVVDDDSSRLSPLEEVVVIATVTPACAGSSDNLAAIRTSPHAKTTRVVDDDSSRLPPRKEVVVSSTPLPELKLQPRQKNTSTPR